MRKRILLSAMALAVVVASSAKTNWSLQGKAYDVDTLFHTTVGPGTTQTSLKLTGGSYLRVSYTTVDLTNPYITLRTVQAGDKLTGGSTPTNMVKKWQTPDCHFVAGTNADFFSGNKPIGSTVVNSEYYYASNNGWNHWGFTADGIPYVGTLTFGGTASTASGDSHAVTAVNALRLENNLIIYTPRFGTTTGTNAYGNEVTAVPVSDPLAPGATVELRVTCDPASAGSMTIPAGGYVISGHGTASTFVKNLKDGDIITVKTGFTADGAELADITQVAGGCPMILSNGEVLNTQNAIDHLTALNPRTAIGYDASRTRVVLLVVDGRWSGESVGVVSKVLADIMKAVGCTEALNFDGGGSSALWTANRGVVNRPSDGTERAVVNGVFAVSNTPTDPEVASIEFVDYTITLPRYGYYKPLVNTYNKYGVWLGTVAPTLSCDPELGEIIDGGSTLLSSGTGTHALTGTYNGATASIAVTIGQGQPEFRLKSVLVDGVYDYPVEVQALVGDTYVAVGNQAFTWSSDDESIATVDELGVVHGVSNGSTTIRAAVDDLASEMTVVVEMPEEHFMALDPLTSTDGWTTSKSNATINSFTADPSGTLLLDYTVTSSRAPSIAIARDFKFWARPDALEFQFDPGTSPLTSVSVNYSCNGARTAVAKTDLSTMTAPGIVSVRWADFFDTDAAESYPLSISKLQFAFPTSGVTNTIKISDLRSIYNVIPDKGNSVEFPTVNAEDRDAPVEYYNLQGIRIDRPASGLVIRRQGTTARPVLIR